MTGSCAAGASARARWRAGRIEDRATGEVIFSKRKYLHENAAKLAAFDALEMLMKKGGQTGQT
jgi:hypothetical protein